MFSQTLVIDSVHLCVFWPAHSNPTESVAVPRPAIQKHRQNDKAFQPIEDVACKSSYFLPRSLSELAN
jgi:hypothetical protein